MVQPKPSRSKRVRGRPLFETWDSNSPPKGRLPLKHGGDVRVGRENTCHTRRHGKDSQQGEKTKTPNAWPRRVEAHTVAIGPSRVTQTPCFFGNNISLFDVPHPLSNSAWRRCSKLSLAATSSASFTYSNGARTDIRVPPTTTTKRQPTPPRHKNIAHFSNCGPHLGALILPAGHWNFFHWSAG